MNAPNDSNKKYRPVLSAVEVRALHTFLKRAYVDNLIKPPYHPDHPNDQNKGYDLVHTNLLLQLVAKIGTLEAKINNNALAPAYTSKQSRESTLLEDLGASPETVATARGQQTKEEYWEWCYNKVQDSGLLSCSIQEIDAANEHMYLNDLMSPEEIASFEAKMFNTMEHDL